jgi:hypothetical protein
MADTLDYELDIGQTFYIVNTDSECIKKGVCRLVDIKIYLSDPTIEEDSVIVNETRYLIETDSGETFMTSEDNVYETFSEAATVLEAHP